MPSTSHPGIAAVPVPCCVGALTPSMNRICVDNVTMFIRNRSDRPSLLKSSEARTARLGPIKPTTCDVATLPALFISQTTTCRVAPLSHRRSETPLPS